MGKSVNFIATIIALFINASVSAKEAEPVDYTQYVSEVIDAFAKQMYKEYGFECGASGGSMPYDIEKISVKLIAYQSATTIERARELEITLTNRFAEIINAHEKIRPFLREYPFPPSRADVAISFREKKKLKTETTENNIAFVFQANNRIYYQAKNPKNCYLYSDIKDESYDEAQEIVYKNLLKKSRTL